MLYLPSLFSQVAFLASRPLLADELIKATAIKDSNCACCHNYGSYLRENGFEVTIADTSDLPAVKRQFSAPTEIEGCHSIVIADCLLEGHAPINIVKRLLTEIPKIPGISLPRMLLRSPRMDGVEEKPLEIYEISDGAPKIYATE